MDPREQIYQILSHQATITTDQELTSAVESKCNRLRKVQKKSENGIKILDLLYALRDSIQHEQSLQNFINFRVLRVATRDWIDVKHSKIFGLVVLIWDQLLHRCSHQQPPTLQLLALLHLQEHQLIQSCLNSDQYLVGFVELVDRFSSMYRDTTYEDSITVIDYCARIHGTDIAECLLQPFVETIEPCFRQLKVPNFDQCFSTLASNLNSVRCPSQALISLNELLSRSIAASKVRGTLTIIPDLPIIKVFPLTPRIKEEFLSGYKSTAEPEQTKLKKKQKLMKKQLVRELQNDQKVVNLMTQAKEQAQRNKKSEVQKGYNRSMEEAHMEYKKLKTTQLNIKRHKKKSTRMGGNKKEINS